MGFDLTLTRTHASLLVSSPFALTSEDPVTFLAETRQILARSIILDACAGCNAATGPLKLSSVAKHHVIFTSREQFINITLEVTDNHSCEVSSVQLTQRVAPTSWVSWLKLVQPTLLVGSLLHSILVLRRRVHLLGACRGPLVCWVPLKSRVVTSHYHLM